MYTTSTGITLHSNTNRSIHLYRREIVTDSQVPNKSITYYKAILVLAQRVDDTFIIYDIYAFNDCCSFINQLLLTQSYRMMYTTFLIKSYKN